MTWISNHMKFGDPLFHNIHVPSYWYVINTIAMTNGSTTLYYLSWKYKTNITNMFRTRWATSAGREPYKFLYTVPKILVCRHNRILMFPWFSLQFDEQFKGYQRHEVR